MENLTTDKYNSGEIIPEILNGIYRYSPLAILLLNQNGNIIGCNRSSELLFGYKEQEIKGFFNPVILPDDRYSYISELEEIKRGQKLENREVIRQKKNGEKCRIIINSYPLIDSSGKTEAIAEFYKQDLNISDNRLDLKNYEDFYDASSLRTGDLLFSLDNNLNLSFVSVNAKNYISEEQYNNIINKNISLLPEILEIPGDKFEKLSENVKIAIKEKHSEFYDTVELVFKNKEINFIINAKLYFSENYEFTGMRGIIRDNTVIKELEYEIADKIHGINFLTKNLDNIIFYTIKENRISILKNNIFGYDSEIFKVKPKLLREIIYPEDAEVYDRKYDEWLKQGMKEILDLEYRIKDRNGKILWVEEHIIHDFDLKGKDRITGLILNISDRKKNEFKLTGGNDSKEESRVMESALLRNLSHELRTPITNILGLTDIINEEFKDDNLKSKIQLINRAGLKLICIIKSINNLSLLDSNELQANSKRTEIISILKDTVNNYISETGYRNITLNFVSDKKYYAISDNKFLQTIISNILDSIVYSANNGGVKIFVEQIDDIENKHCELKIEYKDIQLFKEKLRNIFNDTIKSRSGFESGYDCMDIGLIVAKKMTDRMKGTIEVRDIDSSSSAFIIRLPSEYGISVRNAGDGNVKAEDKSALPKVLIVEDNLTNKVITATFLRNVCTTDHAIDGKTALLLTEKNLYDLILMDINLGSGLNGIETAAKIRENAAYKNVPFIAVTGYAMPGDREKLIKYGFNGYISKPFKKEHLIGIVSGSISDKKVVSESDAGKKEINNIINSFAYAFFTVDSDFKVHYVNETAFDRIKNVRTGESIKTNTDFFDYVINKSEVKKLLETISSGKSISSREKIVNCNSDFETDFEIYNPVFNELNEITGFSYTGICIEKSKIKTGEIKTDEKESVPVSDIKKEKFYYNTENLTTALHLGNIGVWVWDSVKDKYYWSDKFFEIMGVYAHGSEFNITDFASYIHQDDLKRVLTAIKKCITENSSVDLEFRYLKNKEKLSHCRLAAKYVRNNNGSPGKLISIITDITDIIEYKLKLEKKTKELEHINLRKDKFLSMVAHDLRSPFTGLLGLAEILSTNSDSLSKEDVKEISNQIHQSSKQIFNLLENLLEWSRIQRGKINYVKVDLNIKTLIDKIINLYHHNANQKNLTILNRVGENVSLKADLYMTELIFRNLLSNAVKFSKFGGFIYFDHLNEGGYDKIKVTDTGIGISEENIKKLMRIDQNYTSKGTGGETGTGLGLILCKEHLDKNGGKIEVVSELGKGSSFIISFPAEE